MSPRGRPRKDAPPNQGYEERLREVRRRTEAWFEKNTAERETARLAYLAHRDSKEPQAVNPEPKRLISLEEES